MKKICSILAFIAMFAVSFTAKAGDDGKVRFTLHMDAQEGAVFQMEHYNSSTWDYDYVEVKAGDNVLALEEGTYTLLAGDDYLISSASWADSEDTDGFYVSGSGASAILYIYKDTYNGRTLNVVARTMEELRDVTAYITIDDPEQVSISYNGTYLDFPLPEAGVKTEFKISSTMEQNLRIGPKSYGKYLYQVLKNGEECEPTYSGGSYYSVEVAEGDDIEVKAVWPDVQCKVEFETNEAGAKAISKVTTGSYSDSEEVENPLEGFNVQMGTSVYVYFNNDLYNVTKLQVNGVETSQYGYFSFQAKEDTKIVVEAEAYTTKTCTFVIDDPERVNVYLGSTYSGTKLDLVAGENVVEFTDKAKSFQYTAAEDCYIVSVSDGENELYDDTYYSHYIYAEEGKTYTFTTAEIVRDKKFVVYSYSQKSADGSTVEGEDPDATYYDLSIRRSDYTSFSAEPGYNEFAFCDADNDWSFNLDYYAGSAYLYLNDELQEPYYSRYYNVTCSDGDVIKAFMVAGTDWTPSSYNVSFTVDDAVKEGFSVKKDIYTEVEGFDGFSCLQGTQVDIAVAEDYEPVVTVNGVAAEMSEDRVISFNVNADTEVSLSATFTGVSELSSSAAKAGKVFNLQGIQVRSNVEDVNTLPAGIYVIDGKKVVVK